MAFNANTIQAVLPNALPQKHSFQQTAKFYGNLGGVCGKKIGQAKGGAKYCRQQPDAQGLGMGLGHWALRFEQTHGSCNPQNTRARDSKGWDTQCFCTEVFLRGFEAM